MKAVWYERTGPAPEVLTYGDMPTPVAPPGEVRVRLQASRPNPRQLAKWGGGKVIATGSSEMKAGQARLAGAALVINYRNEDVIAKALAFTGQRGVDRVVDVDFGGNIEITLKLMAMNSTIAIYATNGNRTPVVPMRDLMEKCIALRALVLFPLPPSLLAAAQADIAKWLAAGPRLHNVAGQFALSDTAQAHLAVEKGAKLGTVIVDCAR